MLIPPKLLSTITCMMNKKLQSNKFYVHVYLYMYVMCTLRYLYSMSIIHYSITTTITKVVGLLGLILLCDYPGARYL